MIIGKIPPLHFPKLNVWLQACLSLNSSDVRVDLFPERKALRRKVSLESRSGHHDSVAARITLRDPGLWRRIAVLQFRAKCGYCAIVPVGFQRFEEAAAPIPDGTVQSRSSCQIG